MSPHRNETGLYLFVCGCVLSACKWHVFKLNQAQTLFSSICLSNKVVLERMNDWTECCSVKLETLGCIRSVKDIHRNPEI